MTTTTTVETSTTTTEQQTQVTEGGQTTESVEPSTTGSEAPGLSLLTGLTSVIGASYLGSRLLSTSNG